MRFQDLYFEDEVRDGFYVPGLMKRAWAASLEVLGEVARICEKHNIQYFADAGTLLGAVRHAGFIPWDDDLDICMKRKDYERFLAIADKELQNGCQLFNSHTDIEYKEYFSRVVNARMISFDKEHMNRYHGFPFVVGIDIFPLDNIAPDEEKEKTRCELTRLVDGVSRRLDITEDNIEKQSLIIQVEQACNVKLDRKKNIQVQLRDM